MSDTTISPSELMADVLTRLGLPDIAPGGIVVGPANDAQQQAGVVSIVDAGLPVVEKYKPLVWVRTQLRCLSGSLADADMIAHKVQESLHGRVRLVARMASTDQRYLVHMVSVTSGPSMHFDSAETWETLLFAEAMISTDPL